MKDVSKLWVTFRPTRSVILCICLCFALFSGKAVEPGNEKESKTEELAKETQNPVAYLINVPFQNNFNFSIGPNGATQWVLNIQPVIPIKTKARRAQQI